MPQRLPCPLSLTRYLGPEVVPPGTSTGATSLPCLFPHLRSRGRKGRLAAPLQLNYRTLGQKQLGRSGGPGRPLGERYPEGDRLRLPALTRLTLQRHHGHQVVGDIKKGEHRRARKGKGQLVPRRIHHDDGPQQAKQPGRRVPAVRGEKWGRGPPRPRALSRGLEEPCACALGPSPARFGGGAARPWSGRSERFPGVPAGNTLLMLTFSTFIILKRIREGLF